MVKIRKFLKLNGVIEHEVSWICAYNCEPKWLCQDLSGLIITKFLEEAACNLIYVQIQSLLGWVDSLVGK